MITTVSPDPYEMVDRLLPEPKRLWLEALRSDRFRQGQRYLAQVTDEGVKHCCLGVLCEVAIEAGVDVDRRQRPAALSFAYSSNSSLPPPQVTEWAFGKAGAALRVPVAEDNGDPDKAEEVIVMHDLVYLNDDKGWSFEQIAQIIEDTL